MWNARLGTLLLPLGLLVSACGGGGGGGGSLPQTATPPADSAATVPAPGNSIADAGTPAMNDSTISYHKPKACEGFYADGFQLIGGKDATAPENSLAKPAKGDAYADPAYDSCVIRATDHEAEGLAGFARNDYSRRQPFNADDSKFLIYTQGGAWQLYDTETMDLVRELELKGARIELQWHPTNP